MREDDVILQRMLDNESVTNEELEHVLSDDHLSEKYKRAQFSRDIVSTVIQRRHAEENKQKAQIPRPAVNQDILQARIARAIENEPTYSAPESKETEEALRYHEVSWIRALRKSLSQFLSPNWLAAGAVASACFLFGLITATLVQTEINGVPTQYASQFSKPAALAELQPQDAIQKPHVKQQTRMQDLLNLHHQARIPVQKRLVAVKNPGQFSRSTETSPVNRLNPLQTNGFTRPERFQTVTPDGPLSRAVKFQTVRYDALSSVSRPQ